MLAPQQAVQYCQLQPAHVASAGLCALHGGNVRARMPAALHGAGAALCCCRGQGQEDGAIVKSGTRFCYLSSSACQPCTALCCCRGH